MVAATLYLYNRSRASPGRLTLDVRLHAVVTAVRGLRHVLHHSTPLTLAR